MTIEEFQRIWQKKNHGKVADSEHDLQVACVNWFRATHRDIAQMLFAIPNGGWRNLTTAAKLKAEGVVAGVPDLFLAVPRGEYHGLWIEMKNGRSGRMSKNQTAMIDKLQRQGYRCEVCKSILDFIVYVDDYLNTIRINLSSPTTSALG